MSSLRRVAALSCISLLACASQPPALDASPVVDAAGAPRGVVLFPPPGVPWAGVVPVVLAPDARIEGPVLAQIGSFEIDGVAQPTPAQRLDGSPPIAMVDTRALVDGAHRFSSTLWADVDRRVDFDFVVANGAGTPSLGGTFVDVTAAVLGVATPSVRGLVAGSIALDVDGDDRIDLFAWEDGRPRLLRQTGPLTFEGSPVALGGLVQAAGAADLDRDGRPEIVAVGDGVWILRYVAGSLVDATDAGVPLWARAGQRFQGVTFGDLDSDGLLEIAVAQMACGEGASVVLRNEGDLRFVDVATELGLAHAAGATYAFAIDVPDPASGLVDVWSFEEGCTPVRTSLRRYRTRDGLPELVIEIRPPLGTVSPMGSVWIDPDDDGHLDLWVAGDFISPVWAGPDFTRETSTSTGLAGWADGAARPVSAWSMVHLDADMDGWSDVFVVHDPSHPGGAGDPSDALFVRTTSGVYREIGASAALLGAHACRAAHGADLDRDGDLDLLVGCRDGARVLRNDLSAPGAGQMIVLRGRVSNPDGVHAIVTTPSGERRLVRGGGQPYAGGLERVAFVRGGPVHVRWPSGITQTVADDATTEILLVEPDVVRLGSRRVAGDQEVEIEIRPSELGVPDASVEVGISAGRWTRPPTREPDGVWRATVITPPAPAEIVVSVRVGVLELAVRPRIFVR